MTRGMTREEAIKLLICEKAGVEDVDGSIGGKRVRQAYDMAIEALSAEKTGWIPVSERLPENNGRYLVSYEGIIGMRTNILRYGVPSPLHTRGAEKCFYNTDREYGDVPYEDVIAWQPLPDPYKGGDTE